MITRALETTDRGGAHLDARAPAQTYRLVVPLVLELNGAVSHNLAALNATWVGLTNNRLEENFTLPEQMASCTSLPAMLRVYGGYCRTAIEQYQSALRQFQRIGLDLLGEVPATGLVPVKISELQHEHTARSPERATRGALP